MSCVDVSKKAPSRRQVIGGAAAGMTVMALPSAVSAASAGGANSGPPGDDLIYFSGATPPSGTFDKLFITTGADRRAWLFEAGVTSYVNQVRVTSDTGDKTLASVKIYGGTTSAIGSLIGTFSYSSASSDTIYMNRTTAAGGPYVVPAGPVWIEIACSSSSTPLGVKMGSQEVTYSESTPKWSVSPNYTYYDFGTTSYVNAPPAIAPYFMVSYLSAL